METNVVKIPLDKGLFAVIDQQDFELVSKYRWYARKGKNGVFYATSTLFKNIHMHRIILGATTELVDHKNQDGLDNRRCNIRLVTHLQNNCNKRSYQKVSSKFKGVYWNKTKQKWSSQITPPGQRTKHVGHFKSEIEAAKAYNEKAKIYHGDFAYLNPV